MKTPMDDLESQTSGSNQVLLTSPINLKVRMRVNRSNLVKLTLMVALPSNNRKPHLLVVSRMGNLRSRLLILWKRH